MTAEEEATRNWVVQFVVRLGICPFAARPVKQGTVHYLSCPVVEVEEAFYWAATQVQALIGEPQSTVETSLLIFPDLFDEFDDFLDFIAEMEELLTDSGAAEFVQFAHFHPRYRFAGLEADDAANKTNRSPHPVLQLLRVEGVAEAVRNYPDIEAIPDKNIALLRRLAAAGKL